MSTDVDLLDLERVVDGVKGGSRDKEGGVEVDVVEIYRVFGFSEDADDDELFSEKGEGLADRLGGAVEVVSEGRADDGGVGLGVFEEEGAGF